jgi:secondary thiamine-phosphate synthase enzyme
MVVTKTISVQTGGQCDIIDVTHHVQQHIADVGIGNGVVNLFIKGSTAGLSTVEYEPGLVSDFKSLWGRLVPQNVHYDHNSRWGDGNGHSHVRASLLGASLVIPFGDKKLMLGTWQQIVLVDFDNRPRSRQIILQIVGE